MSYHVGGVNLGFAPVMIGAGVCKTVAAMLSHLKIAPAVGGSFTLEGRSGCVGKTFYPETIHELTAAGFGLNAFGMPNLGFKNVASEMNGQLFDHPLIASVAGFSTDEYVEGVRVFSALKNVSAIELNAGCPNTGHGEILSFNEAALVHLLEKLSQSKPEKPIWLKFSPFSNPSELEKKALLVNRFKHVIRSVVTCNTFPNAYAGTAAISTDKTGNFGGLSGPALKHIALGQVQQFRKHLDPEIDIIGVGGITTGNDVVTFIDAGAQAVQLTSMPFWLGDPGKFWPQLIGGQDSERLTKLIQLDQ